MAEATRRSSEPRILPDTAERWGDSFMAVVAVASPGPGTGKTMLAAHLAVQAARLGDGPVVLVEVATAGALSKWASRRRTSGPKVLRCDFGVLPELLRQLRSERKFGLCIVDIAASDAIPVRAAVSAAHLVVIPSTLDVAALEAAADLAEDVRSMGQAALVAVNGVEPEAEFWSAATFGLRRSGLLAPVVLHRDDAVAGAMRQGRTVIESTKQTVLAGDVERLWSVLRRLLRQAPARPGGRTKKARRRRLGPMRVVAVSSMNGEDARTVLAAHLAVQAVRSGYGAQAVLLASVGHEGLARWAAKRTDSGPSVKEVGSGELASLLDWASGWGIELCVLACRLGRDLTYDDIVGRVDLLVLPATADQDDLRTKLLLAAELRELPVVFALVQETSERRAALAVSRDIAEGGGRIAGRLTATRDFEHALAGGSTVMEMFPRSRAAREIVELWARVRTILIHG